jgi:pilus assembly protein CpaE
VAALNLWLTGDWYGLDDLQAELEAQDGISVEGVGGPAGLGGVIVHVTAGSTVPHGELAALREHSPAPVVLLAGSAGPDLVGAAAAAEVDEVLILPQSASAIAFAALKAAAARSRLQGRTDAAPGRVLTVFSPKGGTGKSVTACNLAVALAEAGKRTLLLDLDLQFGDAAIMLGIEPERTIHDLLAAPGALDCEKITGYATRHASGLDVLPAPIRPEDGELVTDTRVAELLDAARDGYELVVVDTAPFFHGSTLAALDRTETLLLLCAPDVPTLKNVRLALQTLELLSFAPERIRLVLNRANARVGFRAAQVASVVERPVDVELPDDETAAIGVNRGTPAVLLRRQSPYSRAIVELAGRIVGTTSAPAPAASSPRKRLSLAMGGRRA